jgi:sulfite reductase (NADPH) flavoprotein alpha-component
MTQYTKTTPFPSKLIEKTCLSREGSSKRTYHLKLDLLGSNISYAPGDAIGVFPRNDEKTIEQLLGRLKKTGREEIIEPRTQRPISFRNFLLHRANLSRITPSMLSYFPDLFPLTEENGKEKRKIFIETHDIETLLSTYTPKEDSLQEFVSHISPILPRFYSIASSQLETPNSVDLLVVTFEYEQKGKLRPGFGSHFLCHTAKIDETEILPCRSS